MPFFKFSGFRILNPQDLGILLVNHKKAREWPETASKGENVDEKRRFERRRRRRRFERRRRRRERRRSTLIVDLGLQLVSTKTDSLATVDS